MAATIAAIAACIAVGVGVLNVILTAWLNARATHQGWLRERVHPLVVAVQAASHRQAMASSAILRSRAVGGAEDNLKPFKDESWVAFHELRTAVAELAVVASPRLHKAAVLLLVRQQKVLLAQDYYTESFGDPEKELAHARAAFLTTAKAELGIPQDSWGRAARTFSGILVDWFHRKSSEGSE